MSGINSMDGCLNLTIDWMYSQVQYDISLNCTATPGMISSTNTTSTLSNGISDILICYNSVNDANILDPIFECSDSYTVEVTLMRLVMYIGICSALNLVAIYVTLCFANINRLYYFNFNNCHGVCMMSFFLH